jgi:hypothetical protein
MMALEDAGGSMLNTRLPHSRYRKASGLKGQLFHKVRKEGAMAESSFPLMGGCLCGSVRYALLGAVKSVEHCHCSMCRTVHGAFFLSGALVDKDRLRIEQGADNLTTFVSSEGIRRQFCRTCGCPLFIFLDDTPDVVYFTAATLDGGKHPGHPRDMECHIYVGSKVEWERIADDLPQFETEAEGIGIVAPFARDNVK